MEYGYALSKEEYSRQSILGVTKKKVRNVAVTHALNKYMIKRKIVRT
jgi:hypothetical protein